MRSNTSTDVVTMSSSVVLEFGGSPDSAIAAKVEDVVENGSSYIDAERSDWLHAATPEQQSHFLVVFRHDTPMGIARARLISDLSDKGVRTNIDPL